MLTVGRKPWSSVGGITNAMSRGEKREDLLPNVALPHVYGEQGAQSMEDLSVAIKVSDKVSWRRSHFGKYLESRGT